MSLRFWWTDESIVTHVVNNANRYPTMPISAPNLCIQLTAIAIDMLECSDFGIFIFNSSSVQRQLMQALRIKNYKIHSNSCTFFSFHFSLIAEIEKTVLPCENKMCFYWWPKLIPPSGWHQDIDHSYHYRINAQAPDGYTFSNAETVIYAKALFKERNKDIKSLNDLVQGDRQRFASTNPGIKISKVNNSTFPSFG